MTNRFFIIGLGLFLIASVFTYSFLGGFNSPEISTAEVDKFTVVGIPFNGKYRSNEAEKAFFEVRSVLDSIPDAHMVIVNYPLENTGDVNYFIGISSEGTLNYKDWEKRTLTGFSGVISIVFNKHNLVMPKPFKVREMVQDYAMMHNLQLLGVSIENYLGEREMEVNFPYQ